MQMVQITTNHSFLAFALYFRCCKWILYISAIFFLQKSSFASDFALAVLPDVVNHCLHSRQQPYLPCDPPLFILVKIPVHH